MPLEYINGVKPEIGFACFTVAESKESGSIRQNVRKSVVKGKKYTLSAAILQRPFFAVNSICLTGRLKRQFFKVKLKVIFA